MRKNILAYFLISLFFGQSLYAQRGANQYEFKKRSKGEYDQRNTISQSNIVNSNNQRRGNTGGIFLSDNEILFETKALMNVKADRFLAVFNLTQIGKNAVETDQLINKRIDGFIKDLAQLTYISI